jgi:hypothetical protein
MSLHRGAGGAFSACSQCSMMLLNPAQFDANSTANPSIDDRG